MAESHRYHKQNHDQGDNVDDVLGEWAFFSLFYLNDNLFLPPVPFLSDCKLVLVAQDASNLHALLVEGIRHLIADIKEAFLALGADCTSIGLTVST